MVGLMYSPSVYNQSCYWSSVVSSASSKSAISHGNSSVPTGLSTGSHQDWMGSSSESGSSLSSYDLFRCAVILAVTCGLISGNLILALAVNCKYSAGILQFQVSTVLLSSRIRRCLHAPVSIFCSVCLFNEDPLTPIVYSPSTPFSRPPSQTTVSLITLSPRLYCRHVYCPQMGTEILAGIHILAVV